MDFSLFTSTADNHTNTIHADGWIVARTATVLPTIAQTDVVMIAATYGLSAHRLGVNHV